jgi:hypothetical protein
MYITKCGVRVCAVFISFKIDSNGCRLIVIIAVHVSIVGEFLTILVTTNFLAKAALRRII